MTNYEDFFAFGFPALIILSGLLISIIPAYIASHRSKSFWVWWFSSAFIFTIFSLIVIKALAFSLLIYLLAILPVVSILALVSKPISITVSTRAKDILFFLSVLAIMVILGATLYFNFLYPETTFQVDINRGSFTTSAAKTFLASLGFAVFIFIVSEGKVRETVAGIFLTSLFALPFLLMPSQVNVLRNILSSILSPNRIVYRPIFNDPRELSIFGGFILLGICSGIAGVAILFNGRYRVTDRVKVFLGATVNNISINAPSIHFSKNPSLSSRILIGVVFIGLFSVYYTFGEGSIFLLPLYFICFTLPVTLVCLAGILLSSVVIIQSINQEKALFGIGILLCGLLAGSMSTFQDSSLDNLLAMIYWSSLPLRFLVFYGIGSGLVSLMLWTISDLVDRRQVENF